MFRLRLQGLGLEFKLSGLGFVVGFRFLWDWEGLYGICSLLIGCLKAGCGLLRVLRVLGLGFRV